MVCRHPVLHKNDVRDDSGMNNILIASVDSIHIAVSNLNIHASRRGCLSKMLKHRKDATFRVWILSPTLFSVRFICLFDCTYKSAHKSKIEELRGHSMNGEKHGEKTTTRNHNKLNKVWWTICKRGRNFAGKKQGVAKYFDTRQKLRPDGLITGAINGEEHWAANHFKSQTKKATQEWLW